MFRKLFKRKHLSDSITAKSNDRSLCNDYNEITTKSKPIIYFSTDKGKYVCANVPDNVNVISNIEYNSPDDYKCYKNISTKSYPQHNRYDSRQLKKDDYKYIHEIYDSYMTDTNDMADDTADDMIDTYNTADDMNDTYDSYMADTYMSNLDKVQNNTPNPSSNLDYISKNFLFDEDDGIYYFKRNDSSYNNSLSYNESSYNDSSCNNSLSYNNSLYSNL